MVNTRLHLLSVANPKYDTNINTFSFITHFRKDLNLRFGPFFLLDYVIFFITDFIRYDSGNIRNIPCIILNISIK